MSWSEHFNEPLTAAEVEAINPQNAQTSSSEEMLQQFRVARELAAEVVISGVVGDPDTHKFKVTISGHANAGHEPAEGWANDMLTISVSQA